MRSIMRWIRQKWQELSGDRLYIVNSLGVQVSGLYVTTAQLPHWGSYHLRLPDKPGPWSYEWRWVTRPIEGVSFSPVTGFQIDLEIARGAEIGVLGRLECVGRCPDGEYRSDPLAVQVVPTDDNV